MRFAGYLALAMGELATHHLTGETADGTADLTGIPGVNASVGVAPDFFAAFNGEAFFRGIDSAGNFTL